MLNMRKKRIDKLIRRTFLEMFLLIFCVVLSYFIFNNGNLSASAKIAEEYTSKENEVQVMVGRNKEDQTLINQNKILDKTQLTVRNPNKTEKFIEINMIITNPQEVDINDLFIGFNGIITEGTAAKIDQNSYKLTIYTDKIEAYENIQGNVIVYTKDNIVKNLEYTFSVNETYYK